MRQNRRARFSPLLPLLIAALISGAYALATLSGAQYFSPRPPTELSVAMSRFPYHLGFVFSAFYLVQLFRGGWPFRPDARASICSRCHGSVYGPPESKFCPCSGDREPLRNWRWVPDEAQTESHAKASNQAMQRTAPRSDE